jgi:hypothetical protein
METILSVTLMAGLLTLWTKILYHSPLLVKHANDAERPLLPDFARISQPLPPGRRHRAPRKAA